MVDVSRALRSAAQTGTVAIGLKSAMSALADKRAKAVVMARNIPPEARAEVLDLASAASVPRIAYEGTNVELGPALGKPFAVSCAAVIDPGDSEIMSAVET